MGWGKAVEYIAGGFKGVTDLLTGRQKRKEREEYRKAGRNEQSLAQHEEADNAQERMDAVEPSSVDDTRDRLRKGKY